MERVLTGEGEAELLRADVFVLHSTEQRLHLHNEQIGTVLPSFGHRADVLHTERILIYSVVQGKGRRSFNELHAEMGVWSQPCWRSITSHLTGLSGQTRLWFDGPP